MTGPLYDRRREDYVRIPKSIVLALTTALILFIPGGLIGIGIYVSHQSDQIDTFNVNLAKVDKKVDELKSDMKADMKSRDSAVDARVQKVDDYERDTRTQLGDLSAAMEYVVRKTAQINGEPPPALPVLGTRRHP